MALDPNEKKAQSVRRALILLLIGLQLITALLVLSITYFSSSNNVDQQVSQTLSNALEKSRERAYHLLELPRRAVEFNQRTFTKRMLDIERYSTQLESYFLAQLAINPEVTSVYFSSEIGEFYSTSRTVHKGKDGFITKIIDSDSADLAQIIYRDNQLNLLESRQDQKDTFQAPEQLWYQQAAGKGKLTWTDPYIADDSDNPVITLAAPVYDENRVLLGVTGADINLGYLLKFLSDLKLSKSISVFVFSKSGDLLLTPDTLITNREEKDFAIEREVIHQFITSTETESNDAILDRVDYENQTYCLQYASLEIPGELNWIIAGYVPEKDFLTEIRLGENRNILIALLILAISLVIGWVLIRRTWQPFEKFFHDVITDQLTGLFNRRFLENIGSRMYIRMLRDQHSAITIAVIDLDEFKKINQEFGNTTGNRVLKEFANFLSQTLRPEDIITRYSGDTFVVIFPGKSNECVVSVMNRLRKKLAAWPLPIDGLLIHLTFSAGVETIDENTQIADAAFTDFIEVARQAMRKAKNKGRDRVISANLSNIHVKTEE